MADPDRAWSAELDIHIGRHYATKADLEKVNASVAELRGELRILKWAAGGIVILLLTLIGVTIPALLN